MKASMRWESVAHVVQKHLPGLRKRCIVEKSSIRRLFAEFCRR